MRKLVVGILIFALCFGLVACGGNTPSPVSEAEAAGLYKHYEHIMYSSVSLSGLSYVFDLDGFIENLTRSIIPMDFLDENWEDEGLSSNQIFRSHSWALREYGQTQAWVIVITEAYTGRVNEITVTIPLEHFDETTETLAVISLFGADPTLTFEDAVVLWLEITRRAEESYDRIGFAFNNTVFNLSSDGTLVTFKIVPETDERIDAVGFDRITEQMLADMMAAFWAEAALDAETAAEQRGYDLIGTWAWDDDSNFTYIFSADGTGMRGFPENMETFTWSTAADGELEIHVDGPIGMFGLVEEQWSYTVSGDALTVTSRQAVNMSYRYTRVS